MKGELRDPNASLVSVKNWPNHLKQSRYHCSGATGQILKACFISIFPKYAPRPKCRTMLVASSNLEYVQAKSSCEIPSFTESPLGDDRSRISLTDPSGFGAAPRGEQCVCVKGGCGKGPDVCPRRSSLAIACVTPSGLSRAERKFSGRESTFWKVPL